MPTKWSATQTRNTGGRHVAVVSRPNHSPVEITYVRGAPVVVRDWSFTDPFGFAQATIDLPMVTGFDDWGSGELFWLATEANLDIYWIPSTAGTQVIDPLTNQLGLSAGELSKANRVWEGFIASIDISDTGSVTMTGLGALFQVDGYQAKPNYPARRIPHEHLIAEQLSPELRPHLRTKPLIVEWPAGWSKVLTQADVNEPTVFTPKGLKVGDKHTGYSTRQAGSWETSLTSFVQDLLAVMFVDDESGVTPGDQWTLQCDIGRQPVLRVRERDRTPDFSVTYGQVGVKLSLSHDATERADMVFGEGVGLNGVNWRNAAIAANGERTDFVPLAYSLEAYPVIPENTSLNPARMVREKFQKFAPGLDQAEGEVAAGKILQRERNPGLTGTLTMSVDPTEMSRWQIRAGMTVRVRHLLGTGANGMRLHINEVVCSPEAGTVQCKVDSKYRDLLTFEEAVARNRDPLLPSRLLQINRRSVLIEDQLAPWDYGAGSGMIPNKSQPFWRDLPPTERFPWRDQTKKYPPGAYPEYYVRVDANAGTRKQRWAQFPVLMSEKGTIRRVEICAVDYYGDPALTQFHLSLYYASGVDWSNMPFDGDGPSPFIEDAFQDTTDTGAPLPPGAYLSADPSLIIGWGDSDQPAGHSPGAFSEGYPVTGLLVDDSTWQFDCTNNPDFDRYAKATARQPLSAYTVYGMLYAEFTDDVYFIGRMYNQPQGT